MSFYVLLMGSLVPDNNLQMNRIKRKTASNSYNLL